MSHTSHQLHEQARRAQRHAELDDVHPGKTPQTNPVKGTAPAAPPAHEDEAFRVFEGDAPQSDG
jgi:hypothetical protein